MRRAFLPLVIIGLTKSLDPLEHVRDPHCSLHIGFLLLHNVEEKLVLVSCRLMGYTLCTALDRSALICFFVGDVTSVCKSYHAHLRPRDYIRRAEIQAYFQLDEMAPRALIDGNSKACDNLVHDEQHPKKGRHCPLNQSITDITRYKITRDFHLTPAPFSGYVIVPARWTIS